MKWFDADKYFPEVDKEFEWSEINVTSRLKCSDYYQSKQIIVAVSYLPRAKSWFSLGFFAVDTEDNKNVCWIVDGGDMIISSYNDFNKFYKAMFWSHIDNPEGFRNSYEDCF